MKLIREYTKRITVQILDACCDSDLTPGQTLTVLKNAKKILDKEIAQWEETVERQTNTPQSQPKMA
jgi:hypothetical protein